MRSQARQPKYVCTSRTRPSFPMRRSSACRLGGGGWDSVTKKASSSDQSRCSTPCHLAASARKNAASVVLRRAAAMAASAVASPYCAEGTRRALSSAQSCDAGVTSAGWEGGELLRGSDGGSAAVHAGRVLLPVGVAALEHAAGALRVVRALPVTVVGRQLGEELGRDPPGRAAVQQQRALPERVRRPEGVLLAPAGSQEPEAGVVVDDVVVTQPAALHDVVPRGGHDSVVRAGPGDLAQELSEQPAAERGRAARAEPVAAPHVQVEEAPPVPVGQRHLGVRALEGRHARAGPWEALVENVLPSRGVDPRGRPQRGQGRGSHDRCSKAGVAISGRGLQPRLRRDCCAGAGTHQPPLRSRRRWSRRRGSLPACEAVPEAQTQEHAARHEQYAAALCTLPQLAPLGALLVRGRASVEQSPLLQYLCSISFLPLILLVRVLDRTDTPGSDIFV